MYRLISFMVKKYFYICVNAPKKDLKGEERGELLLFNT